MHSGHSSDRGLFLENSAVICLYAFVAVLCWMMVYFTEHDQIEKVGDQVVRIMAATRNLAWLIVPAAGTQLRHYLPRRRQVKKRLAVAGQGGKKNG